MDRKLGSTPSKVKIDKKLNEDFANKNRCKKAESTPTPNLGPVKSKTQIKIGPTGATGLSKIFMMYTKEIPFKVSILWFRPTKPIELNRINFD